MPAELTLREMLAPEQLSRLVPLSLMARTAVNGLMAGLHRSTSHGAGGEFLQYRPYTQGDDLRRLDWRLLARSGKLFQKDFQEETDMRCAILLDASASMDYQGASACCTKFRYGEMLAACLTHIAQMQGDKVGLFVYGDTMQQCTMRNQQAPSLDAMLDILEACRCHGGANHGEALARAEDFLGGRRGMIILISDLWGFEDKLEGCVKRIRFAERDCHIFHILDREELELPAGDTLNFTDLESDDAIETSPQVIRDEYRRRLAQHLSTISDCCLNNQANYHRLFSDTSLFDALAALFG